MSVNPVNVRSMAGFVVITRHCNNVKKLSHTTSRALRQGFALIFKNAILSLVPSLDSCILVRHTNGRLDMKQITVYDENGNEFQVKPTQLHSDSLKFCYECSYWKDRKMFYNSLMSHDGKQAKCNNCQRAYQNERRERTKAKLLALRVQK